EVGDHRLRDVDQQSRAANRVLVWHLVVLVHAGGHDDVEVDLLGDALDARDVAAEPPHRGVDDRADALGRQGVELLYRVGDPDLLMPPEAVAVVLLVLGGQDEDVFMHEGGAEVVDVNRSLDGLDGGHRRSPFDDGYACSATLRTETYQVQAFLSADCVRSAACAGGSADGRSLGRS